jgi:IS5 family transposase
MNCSGAKIEPVIGHLKDDCRLRRNPLKGALGDALHVLACAADYNLRWIALFWASILRLFTGIFGLTNQEISVQAA